MKKERSVAIAKLKAHLSAEIKRAREGESITILDHRKPVARLSGLETGVHYTSKSRKPLELKEHHPLVRHDIDRLIDAERADSW